MAIIGLTLSAELSHQSVHDTAPVEDRTTFKLGTLDSRIMGKLRDDATSFAVNPLAPEDEVDVSVGQNTLYYLACQFGIKGWSQFRDIDGNDIPYRTMKRNVAGRSYVIVADEVLRCVPQQVIAELGAKIIEQNDVTPEDVKN